MAPMARPATTRRDLHAVREVASGLRPIARDLRRRAYQLREMVVRTAYPRVLLADDDGALRNLIAATLRADGYSVVEVSDGTELLDLIGSLLLFDADADPLDLIISDFQMPGFSGLDVLADLRSCGLRTQVLLITAFGSEEVRAQARRLGAVAVMDKPFGMDDLRAAVYGIAAPGDPMDDDAG